MLYKEIIIITIILMAVVTGDFFAKKHIKESVQTIDKKLEVLREDIIKHIDKTNQNSEENSEQKVEDEFKKQISKQYSEISGEWEKNYKTLAFYIDHDELEKVKTEIIILKSSIDTKKFSDCIEQIDKCIYILEHIEGKEAFNLKNIF